MSATASATNETIKSTDTPHVPPSKTTAIEHRVDFTPHLSDQRCIWILTIIREHKITSVLDVGCGEGTLLWSLSNGAPWLPDTAHLPGFAYTHVRTLHGLDISDAALSLARASVTPPPASRNALPRWQPLRATLWHGGLQKPNDELKGVECIVASEVIEHLPARPLAAFAPVLLGCYAPKLLLLTTPSYTFNRLFVPPDAEDTWAEWGHASPTQPGRRVRHDDHQFEWTPREAREWARAAGGVWGYDVRLSGVGRPAQADPWGRTVMDDDEDAPEGSAGGCASLVIEFRRREGSEESVERQKAWETWRSTAGATYDADEAHECVAVIEQAADESAGHPLSTHEIAEAARQVMRDRQTATAQMYELWDRELAVVCGGSRVALLEALDADERFSINREDAEAQQWEVALVGQEGEDAKQARDEPVPAVDGYASVEGDDEGGAYENDTFERGSVPLSWRTGQISQGKPWGSVDVSSTNANSSWGDSTADSRWGAGDSEVDGNWGTSAASGGWGASDPEDTWSNGTNSGDSVVEESK